MRDGAEALSLISFARTPTRFRIRHDVSWVWLAIKGNVNA